MGNYYLGAFEQLVLVALVRLGDAYGMKVRREIASRTRRDVAIGAVYATLDRLEEKVFISSHDAPCDSDHRDGHARRFFRIAAPGLAALDESWKALKAMRRGLSPVRSDV